MKLLYSDMIFMWQIWVLDNLGWKVKSIYWLWMNSWKLSMLDGLRLLCRFFFFFVGYFPPILEHMALTVQFRFYYFSNWMIGYLISLRISKWSGLLKPWNAITKGFACLMMIYRWECDTIFYVCLQSSR